MLKTIALLMMLPTASYAQYISGKGEWDGMSDIAKLGYVMGSVDGRMAFVYDIDVDWYRKDLQACLYDLNVNPKQMVQIVNQGYQDLTNWEYSPDAVLADGLRKVCFNAMNRARAARGAPLLE